VYTETEVTMRSDAELLRSADAGAFQELYDRHSAWIHRFQVGRTRDPHGALDLTAETFAQARRGSCSWRSTCWSSPSRASRSERGR
jgi:DNA-directed RNA polymerase specialized sigma24 family protein